jgi:cytoskeletal protein CcmA (bactofilin family)
MRRSAIILFVLVLALAPVVALAAGGEVGGGLVVRVNGDYTLPEGQQLNTLVTIRGDATVDGTVHDYVLVVKGDALIRGSVEGDVQVVDGTLTLGPNATVKNIRLLRSDLVRNPGATVTGDITRSSRFFFRPGWAILFGALLYLGLGLTLLTTALGFSMLGGNQLRAAAATLTEKPGWTILSGMIAFLAFPLVAVIAMASIVGVWVGLGIIFVLIPVLTLLGYVTAGTMLGSAILNRRDRPASTRPVPEALLGTILLLFVFAIPGVNVLALFGFALWGTGGIVYGWWAGLHTGTKPPAAPPAAPVTTPTPTG